MSEKCVSESFFSFSFGTERNRSGTFIRVQRGIETSDTETVRKQHIDPKEAEVRKTCSAGMQKIERTHRKIRGGGVYFHLRKPNNHFS